MHPYNSDPCDDQNACTMNDICSDGECTGTSIDCTDDDPCTINEGCDPEIGCVADPYCEDDGGPCTIDECDPQTGDCTYEPMWGPWDTCAPDDCLIGLSVPPQLFVNNDDDNGNGILDLKEPGPIIGEDDLQMVTVDASGCPEPCGLGWALGEGGHPHQCFFGSNKTDPIEWPSFPQDWPVPGVLWMEGTAATDSCGVPTLFIGDKGDGSGKKCCEVRSTPIQVVAVDSLEWREAAAYPDIGSVGGYASKA